MKPLVIFIIGPTAAGKSEVAIELAKKIKHAEIISADSMQVYKTMDIGTAKPSNVIRGQIPHHLIDIINPSQEYSCMDFSSLSKKVIQDIIKRKNLPIIAGGSGLYVRSLLDGIFPGPGADLKIRQDLIEEANTHGTEVLYDRLKHIDPIAAKTIGPSNLRRIIRALEVFEHTKKPISELQKNIHPLSENYTVKIFGLTMDRKKLYERINRRVDKMLEQGLLKEVENLTNIKISRSASQALGYKQLFSYLSGECSFEEAVNNIKRNTRRFAKRQLTWFRPDNRIQWINVDDFANSKEAADEIAGYI